MFVAVLCVAAPAITPVTFATFFSLALARHRCDGGRAE